MVKLFIVCSKRNKADIENYLYLQHKYDLLLPTWFGDGEESSDNFKEDIEKVKKSDIVLVIDPVLNLYTYSQIYESYRQEKPIYVLKETNIFKTLLEVIGIKYKYIKDINLLPISKHIKIDEKVYNLFTEDELKDNARNILNDIEKEPLMAYISRDTDIIFEWQSDPEKVDYCKYFVQFILYLNGGCNLKVMYYNEVVCDKFSRDIESEIYKLNRYLHDFDSLMR